MISSEYFVLLWLIPVTLCIIIPLAICFGWLTARLGRDLAAGRIPFNEYFSRRHFVMAESQQRRKEQRVSVQKQLMAEITDGVTTISGMVANISRMGMCIMGIPASMTESGGPLTVVIRNSPVEMQIVGVPRWRNPRQPGGTAIGMAITSSPADWDEYVESY